ncbi:MAG: serine protease, partial [Bdellovibrio sp.]
MYKKMKKSSFQKAFLIFIGLFFSVNLWGQNYVPGEVIVKLKSSGKGSGSGSVARKAYSFVGKMITQRKMSLKMSWSRLNMYNFKLAPNDSVQKVIQDLKNDPDVEYVEPNYYVNKASVTGLQEKYTAQEVQSFGGSYPTTSAPIHVTDAWSILSTPSQKPIVAVIDTGLDLNHTVFQQTNSIYTNPGEIPGNGIDDDMNGYVDDVHGWNFVSQSGNMIDDDGHGTHVAGIILGVGQDIYSPPFSESKIQIMPLKFLDGNGIGKTSDAIQAIYYAVNMGASVINNSWGGPGYSAALHEAIVYSYNKGVSFVAAAGNSATNNDSAPMYPASYDVPNVIAVAATTDSDVLASFSNYGYNSVHLGSPGSYILSTIPGNQYGSMSGTSMAAPFVSGVAALIKVESPQMLGYQIKSIILGDVDGVGALSQKVSSEGRLNVLNAVQKAKTATVLPTQPGYTFSNQDRGLASALATGGGGCGMVKAVYSNFNQQAQGNGQGSSLFGGDLETWYVLIVVGIMTLPLILLSIFREKDKAYRRQYERFNINT